MYLAVLLDLCTREVVGWATAVRRDAALVIALAMASRAGRLVPWQAAFALQLAWGSAALGDGQLVAQHEDLDVLRCGILVR